MSAVAELINFVISSLLGVLTLLVLLRFVFQWVKADFYNPISQGIVKITSPVLTPLRRVIPGVMGLDLAALVLAFLISFIATCITVFLKGQNPFTAPVFIMAYSLIKVLASVMNIFAFALLASIILSFVAPMSRHPAAILAVQVAEPLMTPFRKLIPPMGGIDISPIFVFIAFGVAMRLLVIMGAAINIRVHTMFLFVFV